MASSATDVDDYRANLLLSRVLPMASNAEGWRASSFQIHLRRGDASRWSLRTRHRRTQLPIVANGSVRPVDPGRATFLVGCLGESRPDRNSPRAYSACLTRTQPLTNPRALILDPTLHVANLPYPDSRCRWTVTCDCFPQAASRAGRIATMENQTGPSVGRGQKT